MNYFSIPGLKYKDLIYRNITFNQVIGTVCDLCEISLEDVMSTKRNRLIAEARQIVCWIMVNICNKSKVGVGRQMKKDHTTVIYACTTVNNLMETDPMFKIKVNKILEALY